MSYSPVVNGLKRLRYPRANNTAITMPGLALEGGAHLCTNWYGIPVSCPSCGDSTSSFSVDLADIPFDATVDYFAVSVTIDGPYVTTPGTCHTPASPVDDPCGGPGDPALYDATLTGSYLRATSDHGDEENVYAEAIPAEFSFNTDTTSSGAAWPRDVPHPGRNVSPVADLINPDATWPTPDAFGNEFGQCLFTLAQLPASIGLTIVHHNREQTTEGRWRVSVIPYLIVETEPPPPPDAAYQYVTGGA